ncbi:MAG TPA: 3-oxoacyl-ACP reductase FabG [Bdellovibrionales bacterium]|nr:3-oxoacyl-ACP reductase FabG [Bdellovibrionales bacterium]
MSIKFDFSGRHAVVTGGARGIGFEVARQFLEAGASVTIWEFSESAIAEAQEKFNVYGARARFHRVDVSKLPSCEDAAKALASPIHILINNAGITRDKSFAKMSAEEFNAVIDTCLGGVFNATKSVLDRFDPADKNKRIVNISSVVALYGNFGQANYVAAKAGVIGLTKTLSRELGGKGFTVNVIAPGFTATAMTEAMPETARSQLQGKIPAGRLGQPADIANACLFLASNEASYVNGATISVDGGLVI